MDAPAAPAARRDMAAGHVLVVVLVALVLGSLLNAQGLREGARIKEPGWQRDVGLALTRPLAAVSGWLRLDRPRAALRDAVGRDDERLRGGTAFTGDGPPPLPPPAGEERRDRPVFTSRNRARLWIAGDSLVVRPGESILRAAASTRAVRGVAPVDGRVATGLARPDVFDWYRHIRRELQRRKPDAVVLAFGANDDHDVMAGVPGEADLGGFGSQAWVSEYRRRVAAVMDLVARRAALLLWLGLPITSDAAQTTRFETINAIAHAEAERRGSRVVFVDTYTLLTGPAGGYAEYLTDDRGALVRVRSDDGVHLERAGADLVAEAVMRELGEAFELRP
jgi:hypothetical protein